MWRSLLRQPVVTTAVLLLGLGWTSIAAATTVGLRFEMPDRQYRDEFTDQELKDLEVQIPAKLSLLLHERIPYLDFSEDTDSDYLLTLRLDRKDPQAGNRSWEFGFHANLSGPNMPPNARGYWVFRGDERYGEPLGTAEQLVREILSRVDHDDVAKVLTDRLLKYVSLSDSAVFEKSPSDQLMGWRFKEIEPGAMCLGEQSTLRFYNRVEQNDGSQLPALNAQVFEWRPSDEGPPRLFCIALKNPDPPGHFDRLMGLDAEAVTVERIHVLRYERTCPGQFTAVDPLGVSF